MRSRHILEPDEIQEAVAEWLTCHKGVEAPEEAKVALYKEPDANGDIEIEISWNDKLC